jgi:hypothetical protein
MSVLLAGFAGVFGGWVLARHGFGLLAATAPLVALAVSARVWTQSRLRAGPRLERRADGTLSVCGAGETAIPALLGRRTRRLGPSVFLEVGFVRNGRRTRYVRWLTPFDVPANTLRRWTVVLPCSGRAARS